MEFIPSGTIEISGVILYRIIINYRVMVPLTKNSYPNPI